MFHPASYRFFAILYYKLCAAVLPRFSFMRQPNHTTTRIRLHTRWDSCWHDIRPRHGKLSRSHESKSMNRGEYVAKSSSGSSSSSSRGFDSLLRSGGRNNQTTTTFPAVVYMGTFDCQSFLCCLLLRENDIHLISLLCRFVLGSDGQKLTRMVYLERLTAFLHAPLPWEEPSVHLFPPTCIFPSWSFSEGVKYIFLRDV